MNIPADFFSFSTLAVSYCVWSLCIIWAAFNVNWVNFREIKTVQHIFLASVIALSILAIMRAGILPGLSFHILGATAATMMMGWPLAILCMSLAQLVIALAGFESLINIGINGLLMGCVPICMTHLFYVAIVKRLPKNPFVFIMVSGFFNGAITIALTAVIVSVSIYIAGIYSDEVIWHNYTRYLPLMMFPEGFLNGMFISGMVAFQPLWLSYFDEDSYFNS